MRLRALALLAAAACDPRGPIAGDDLALRVTAGATAVDFGASIPLTVVRSWRKGLAPQDWNEKALAPLRLRLVAASRRSSATHVEDTRRYDAHVFGRDTVKVAVPAFLARDADGSERSVPGPELTLRVRSGLPATAGDLELPGEPLPLPKAPRWPLVAALAAAALALGFALRRRRTAPARAAAPAAPVHAVAPHVDALRRLALLRAESPADAAATQAHFTALASVVRDYVAARFGVPAVERTTDEILAAPALATLARGLLAQGGDALLACDLVKFARALPSAAERGRTLDAAEALVRGTALEAGA